MDISRLNRIKSLKLFKPKPRLSPKHFEFFFRTLAELLQEGFSIDQALAFLAILLPEEKEIFEVITSLLSQGDPLEQALNEVDVPVHILSQIFYSQRQGRLTETLLTIAADIRTREAYKKKLLKALAYPLFMLVFLLGLLFGMRAFILPHIVTFISQELFEENGFVRLLLLFFNFLPQITVLSLSLMLLLYFGFAYYLSKQTYLQKLAYLQKIPLLNKWVSQWVSYKLSYQLAYFYEGGYSIQQIIQLLLQYPLDAFLMELAGELERGLMQGIEFPKLVEELGIFTPEFPYILHQGELTSQLASKCQLYAQKVFSDLLTDISRKISLIQPVLFIFIALLVMAMYLLMMLPMLTIEGL